MSRSLIFFLRVLRFTPSSLAARIWLPFVAASDSSISGRYFPQDTVVEPGGRQAVLVRGEVGAQVMLHRAAQRIRRRGRHVPGGLAFVQLVLDDVAIDGFLAARKST